MKNTTQRLSKRNNEKREYGLEDFLIPGVAGLLVGGPIGLPPGDT